MSEIEVKDNPAEKRYEITVDGSLAGFAAYIPAEGMRVFSHTEVDSAYEGQGVGSKLVRAALDDVRAQGTKVMALCPFVLAFIRRHPEYADLQHNAPRSTATD
jgi:predicted GNAT family acetyltransferase